MTYEKIKTMKKILHSVNILIILLLSFICMPGTGQQNGTFKTVYCDSIRPIPGKHLSLYLKNDTAPYSCYINDTALIPYIIFWSKKGNTLDSSKLVTKYDIQTGMDLPTILNYTDGSSNNANLNVGLPGFGDYVQMDVSDVHSKTTGVILQDTSMFLYAGQPGSTARNVILQSNGLAYNFNQVVNNPYWIPNKEYV